MGRYHAILFDMDGTQNGGGAAPDTTQRKDTGQTGR